MAWTKVEVDDEGYPTWKWPSKADQLLFDIGFSYALMKQAERILTGLYAALGEEKNVDVEANKELRDVIGYHLAKIANFNEKRLAYRDEVYEAGYAIGDRLTKAEAAKKGNGEMGKG
jgi:hypothetical protein